MSTGLTFLCQRQCPHHHVPLFYCIHCVLHTASTSLTFFVSKTRSLPPYMTIPLRTVSTVYCIYCIHWFNHYAPKTMFPPPYTAIPLHTASTASTSLSFLHQRQFPYHHIPLFHCVLCPQLTASTVYCIHCILHPLRTVSTGYCVHCIHCMPYMAYVGNLFAVTKCPPHPLTLLITHETITNQKLVISNQYLMSPPPTKKVLKTYTFLAAWPI